MLKEKEIAFSGKENPDVLFQLFQIYESCPIQKFQEAIGELRRKYNRRDPSIKKEYLMAEALSSYDMLVLEKKWITQDLKSVAFTSFVSKASSILDKIENGKSIKDKSKTKKFKKNQDTPRCNTMKFEKQKHGTPSTKVVKNKTYYWCDKPHGKAGKPMWALHKPSEHKEYSKPKTSNAEIEATDELRSLLRIYKKDF